ncbi:MAG: sugar kinase, partial [Bacteroidetes bacterium HGW-Bacteroidetes-23]
IRTQTGITAGIIKGQNHLTIESLMPTGGIIFSDGIESDFLKFNSGAIVTIGIAAETANIVMNK